MRAYAKLQIQLVLDFLSRMWGRKSRDLEKPALPQSHFYPSDSLTRGLLDVSEDYLLYSGWRNSRSQRRSVDRHGKAIPWLTYPSIAFLDQLDLADKTILEFGGGGSTAYFSRRAKHVLSVELDGLYIDSLRRLNLGNVDFFEWHSCPGPKNLVTALRGLATKDASYESSENIEKVLNCASRLAELAASADLILIDGGPRTLYAEITSQSIKETAIVVVDNTDMPPLLGLTDRFPEKHFLKIPFKGLGPLNAYGWETTILLPRTYVG